MTNRLPMVDAASGTSEQQQALIEWATDRGQSPPNVQMGDIWGMLVASPEGMRRVGKLGAFARVGTGLPPLVRETAAFVAVWQRGFQYEVGLHERNLLRLGAEADLIVALRERKTGLLPDGVREAAELAWAMARSMSVDQSVFDTLRSALGDNGLVELLIVTGYYLMLSDLARGVMPDA